MAKLKSKLLNDIYDSDSVYDLEQAIEIVKKASSVKFDESVDLAINLNVDPRHAEENIRVSTSLPKGTGKNVVLLVLAQGEKVQEALDAGADYCGNKEYLDKIKYDVPRLIDSFEPDFIFYLSGVDIIENDKLGRLSVSIEGCKERDRFVLNYCKTNKIPVQVSMGGGYSPILKDRIEAHSNTFRLAQEIYFWIKFINSLK